MPAVERARISETARPSRPDVAREKPLSPRQCPADESPDAPTKSTKRSAIALALVLALATAVRWQHLDDVGYSQDESFCWKMTTFGFDEIWHRSGLDNHPPLYFYLLRAWSAAFGKSPEALRALSVLFGVAAVAGAYLLVREMTWHGAPERAGTPRSAFPTEAGERALPALTGAALVALNTHQIDWSQQLRMYSLGAALSLVSSWLLLRALRERASAAACAWYGLSAILLSYTHYFGLLVLTAHFLYAVGYVLRGRFGKAHPRSRPVVRIRNLATTFAVIALAWLPWLPSFLVHRRQTIDEFWTKEFHWQDPARVCFQMFATYFRNEPPNAAIAWSVLAACCLGVAAMLFLGRSGTRLIGLAAAITFAAALAASLHDRNVFVARYFLFAQAMFLCGLAALIAATPYCRLRDCTLAAAGFASACLCVQHAERRREFVERPGMMAAMAYLADVQEADEFLVVANPALQVRAAAHAVRPERIFVVSDDPSSFPFYQGRAVMRDDEYLCADGVARLGGRRLWAVDTGGRPTEVPDPWVDVFEEVFPEWLPADSRIVVHCYERRPRRQSASAARPRFEVPRS